MSSSYKEKIKSSLLKAIEEVDFFSMKPSDRITFESSQSYSTTPGKLASWVLVALTIATFVNFGGNMIYRKNPQSVTSQIVTSDPAYLNLPDNGFFMAFGLQDLRNKSVHYIDESIYTVKMIQRTKIGTNITLQDIPVERCSLDRVPNKDDLRDYYKRNQINNLYCISHENTIDVALQSTWDGPLYRNVLINIYPCQNSSSKSVVCRPSEEIQAYLNFANYAMYFTNLAVNPNNFEKPITFFGKQLYTPISSETLTYIEMLFGHLDFVSDDGFLFENQNSKTSATYLSNRQILTFNPTMVVQIDMKLDKVKTIYNRFYDKLQEVLANMGGIIQSFTIIANMLVLPLIKLRFRLSLANNIFTFKTSKKVKEYKSKNQKKPRIDPKKSMYALKNNGSIMERHSSIDSQKNLIHNYFKQGETNKLKISYLSYFCTCFGNEISKLSNQLLKKGLTQIDQMLDISYIMNKLTEIDVLKVLLFDKTQRELFEYIPKPEISLEENDQSKNNDPLHKEINKHYGRRKSEKARLAFEAYYQISQKKEKTPLDEKLLQLVPKLNKKKNENKMNVISKLSMLDKKIPENNEAIKKKSQNFFIEQNNPKSYSEQLIK